jgi:alpha-L-rhamnosidase
MQDWRDMQSEDGDLPYTAPTYEGGGGPAWSGIVIQLPWQMYVQYGDRRVLEDNWPMMIRWLGFLETQVGEGLLQHYGDEEWGFLGDWVPPGRGQPKGTRVDEHSTLFFNNCYWYWSLKTAAEIADVLGKAREAERLRVRAAETRETIHEYFWEPERGVYANGEQPYLAFPLLLGLPPEELQTKIEARLEKTILEDDSGHINAGINGHALVLEYLTRAGRSDLVFEMASKTTYPSWGYMLEKGATTIWEQWDGKNSLCHSSFLGIGAWFIRGLAGIAPDPKQPGYKHFFVRPQICGNVTSCEASYDSIRGLIKSSWRIEDGIMNLEIVVPPGTSATVILPGQAGSERKLVEPGEYSFSAILPE